MDRGPLRFLLRAIAVVAAAAGLLIFLFSVADPSGASGDMRRDAVGLDDLPTANTTGSILEKDEPLDLDITTTNLTLQGVALAKRVTVPDASPEVFGRYRCKGERLLDLMFTSMDQIVTVDSGGGNWQSTLSVRDFLHWTRPPPSGQRASALEVQDIAYLNGLTYIEAFPRPGTAINLPNVDNDLTRALLCQTEAYQVRQSPLYQPTGGFYDFWISQRNKLIVINGAWSPQDISGLAADRLPALHRFSDVMYLEVARLTHFGAPPTPGDLRPPYNTQNTRQPPQWMVVKDLYGPEETLGIISWCLNLRIPMASGIAYPRWENRQTFPIGSQCHAALLASAPNLAVAMFYLTHKYRFRNWALGSVTIFSNGNVGPYGERPTLIWWVGRADNELRHARQQNKRAEISNSQQENSDPGMVVWPYAMKPIWQ